MRFATTLGLVLLLTLPARAESLRPPVDDAVLRDLGGGGAGESARIGAGALITGGAS